MLDFKNKKVALLGLGIEGVDAANFLLKEGAALTVFDEKKKEDLNTSSVDGDFKLVNGSDYLSKGLKGFDFVVRSPGFYRFMPEIVEAEESGVIVTSPIKIFFEVSKAKIIGVTGTKGKGTTSTLIYEILKKSGKDVYLAGNIGKPYLKLLPKLNNDSIVVLEMSSFQLIDMNSSPDISVVLNITSDHMDWHKSGKEYVEAKKNIVKYQEDSDFAVVNEEYESSKEFSKETKAKVVFFSKESLDSRFKRDLALKGDHNLENISAAISVARILKIDEELMEGVVKNFKGLEHRLELAGEVSGVKYYDDSFATGPQPTIAAVNAFEEPTTLILGGYDKGLDYKELYETLSGKTSVKAIVLIGDLANRFESTLKEKGFGGRVINLGKSEMEKIVETAKEATPKGGVVLLSPAAASFDMFENYKDRGSQFKKAARNLS